MINKKKIKVLLTGAHNTPPLAVWKEMKRRGYSNFLWVGQRKSIIGDKNYSAEYKVTQKYGIPFQNIFAGKLRRDISLHTILWLLRIPIGFIQAFLILLKFKPDIIITFGSHVGLPIVIAGKILSIPIIAHEQAVVVGIANRIIQRYADIVCYSWKESEKYLEIAKKPEKYFFTGNPIREGVLNPKHTTIKLNFTQKKPIIFISGGNQGSHILNKIVKDSIYELIEKYNVIHQTGRYTPTRDYEKHIELSAKINKNGIAYIVFDYLFEDDMGLVLSKADLVISRAGANSCYEYIALAKPAILIPLPFSPLNEQLINAKLLENEGMALLIPQEKLTPQHLVESIENVMKNILYYKDKAKRSRHLIRLGATKQIADIAEKLLEEKHSK